MILRELRILIMGTLSNYIKINLSMMLIKGEGRGGKNCDAIFSKIVLESFSTVKFMTLVHFKV